VVINGSFFVLIKQSADRVPLSILVLIIQQEGKRGREIKFLSLCKV